MSDTRYTFTDGEGEHRIFKLAVEEITFCFDFGPRLGVGKTLASGEGVTITCVDETTPDLAASEVDINGTTFTDESDPDRTVVASEGVLAKLSGGTEGYYYDAVVFATDSDGDVKAGRVRVDVI